MELEKGKITYKDNDYDVVYITLEDGIDDELINEIGYHDLVFADIGLWLDLVGKEKLQSDERDLPCNAEAREIDNSIYYYDVNVSRFCAGEMNETDFKRWVYEESI